MTQPVKVTRSNTSASDNFQSLSSQKREGLGSFPSHPDSVNYMRQPYVPVYLMFTEPNQSVRFDEVRNVTSVTLQKVLVYTSHVWGADELPILEVIPSDSSHLSISTRHNFNNLGERIYPLDKSLTLLAEDHDTPIVLKTYRDASGKLCWAKVNLINQNGDSIPFDSIHLKLQFETLNWQ
jgi:hypothetical protein